ncbi:MAG: serine/threonine-protein phosphatase [Leptospiraceae bacterium]|nr:serine/threonine-protein phosphatase [Leptospiraceae bacterium]
MPEIPKFDQYRIFYKYLPLNPVGGDFISLQRIDGGLLSILVGDVVGHGISAALISSLVNVLANKNREKNGLFPGKYLENLNKEANNYLAEDYYFTALYGLLSSSSESTTFTFSRGGHPYPFIYSHREKCAKIFEIEGTPLGLMNNLTYTELSVELFPGDRIYIITDGLIEVKNEKGKLLGNKNFCHIITEACNTDMSLEESIDFILNKVDEFSMGVPPDDDRFILGIEINVL